jgi:hypothetical protein
MSLQEHLCYKNSMKHLYYPVTSLQPGRTMAQAVIRRPLTAEARVHARSAHVEFVVDKVALGQVFLRVLRFSPVKYNSTVAVQLIASGGWTIYPLVAAVHRRSLTPSKSIPTTPSINLASYICAQEPEYFSQHSVWLRTGWPGDQGSIPGRSRGFFL